MNALQHAVLDEDGIIVVTGEVGSGKTMLCRMLADRLRDSVVDLVYLANPSFGPREILASLVADWGLRVPTGQPVVLSIQAALIERHRQGRRVVVLIDEAQSMPPDSLQEIKLLSNLETAQHKLLQIVLFGQPELDELLALPRLRQVRDRVVHRFVLPPLSEHEAMTYLEHRLRRAGWRGARLFRPKAAKRLATAAAGRIRAIHLLADKALLAAYANGCHEVLPVHVNRAVADLKIGGEINAHSWLDSSALKGAGLWGWAGAIAALALLLGLVVGWTLGQRPMQTASAVTPSPPVPTTPVSSGVADAQTSSSIPTTPSHTQAASPVTVVKTPQLPLVSPSSQDIHQPSALHRRYADLPQDVQQQIVQSRLFLDDPESQGWTIQMGLAHDVSSLRDLLARLRHLSPVWVHDRDYSKSQSTKNRPVWAVYSGRYSSRAQAHEAILGLPVELQQTKPLIRTFAGIRSEPYPEHPPS